MDHFGDIHPYGNDHGLVFSLCLLVGDVSHHECSWGSLSSYNIGTNSRYIRDSVGILTDNYCLCWFFNFSIYNYYNEAVQICKADEQDSESLVSDRNGSWHNEKNLTVIILTRLSNFEILLSNTCRKLLRFNCSYYEDLWYQKSGVFKPQLLGLLPYPLQMEICYDLNALPLFSSLIFRKLPEPFLRRLSLAMSHQFYLPGDIVYNHNQNKTIMVSTSYLHTSAVLFKDFTNIVTNFSGLYNKRCFRVTIRWRRWKSNDFFRKGDMFWRNSSSLQHTR